MPVRALGARLLLRRGAVAFGAGGNGDAVRQRAGGRQEAHFEELPFQLAEFVETVRIDPERDRLYGRARSFYRRVVRRIERIIWGRNE